MMLEAWSSGILTNNYSCQVSLIFCGSATVYPPHPICDIEPSLEMPDSYHSDFSHWKALLVR